MDSTTYHDNTGQRDKSGVSADSLTLCQYTHSPEGAATSPASRDWNGIRRFRWLRLGFSQAFDWNQIEISVPHLPPVLEGLRIVHLTDMHLRSRWQPSYDLLLGKLRQDPPDLILCTGDFVDDVFDSRSALPILQRFLTQLSSRLGVFGIVGNHDRDLLTARLQGWGVSFIAGKYVRLESDKAAIELIGLGGVKRRDFDPEWAETIQPPSEGVPRIILAHYPDQIGFVGSLQADVMLCGHTHGGQICLPGGRALVTHDSLPKRMARGAHRVGKTLMIVNRGFGTVRYPIRVFCPAEVVELRLTAAGN
jgi:uncharacterized protein